MNPLQIFLALRAHYRAAILVFFLTIIAGAVVTLLMPKKYVGMATLVFDVKTPDPVAGAILQVAHGYMETQVEVVKSDRMAKRVIDTLKLDQSPEVIQQWKESGNKILLQQWLVDRVKKGLTVSQLDGGNIIEIAYAAEDPVLAAKLANSYSEAYILTNIELRVDPARQYSKWFSEQAKGMRENLEKAQTRLSEYQQKKGIVSKEGEMDAESTKLNELVAQLTLAQGQTVELQSKARSSEVLPGFSQDGALVQTLKGDIARLEVKLLEAGQNLGRNHPQYQRMEAELASLKNQMEVEKLNISRQLSVSRNVSRDNESQLRYAIEAQKKKLLALKGGQDELAVLQRDVDAARSAYDTVVNRYNQTSLESQIDQSNVSVLNTAVEQQEPASPNIKKSIVVILLASILAGLGMALLLETLDRRVRSVQDLEEMLQIPVLAVLSPPKKHNRLTQLASQTLRLEYK